MLQTVMDGECEISDTQEVSDNTNAEEIMVLSVFTWSAVASI